MATLNYKVAGFSSDVKSDLGLVKRNDFRRDGAYSKDGITPSRFVYNFDGVDDYGVLATRAINPDGDIDIEFRTGSSVPSATGVDRTVVSQCLTSTFASKEFSLYFNAATNALQAQVGGTYLSSAPQAPLLPNTLYRYTLSGTTQRFFLNGVQVRQDTVTRGAAREPTAQTVLMAQTHGSPTTFRAFGSGMFFDIRINGTLWQMADRNQAIQLPNPDGLGAELITPAVYVNPAVKGSQWTLLDGGRWQYVGDGTLNQLQFIISSAQPNAGFVEFEVESISGSMTCSIGQVAGSTFSNTGVFRYFYTNKDLPSINSSVFQIKRAGTSVASCVIKNISFKPLDTCNPMQLVNTTNDRWQEIIP